MPQMIVSCPSCATRYDLPDNDSAADGSVIRCASCGHSWIESSAIEIVDATPQPAEPVEMVTNLPATVYGDDGISLFPATIISGGTVVDAGGMVYDFGPGEYRFPFVAPGSYRLDVTAPAGYSAPSVVPTALLQALPGAPYAINEQGSRGQPFAVPVGPAIQVDIPLDPAAVGFFLVKDVNRREASAGDFLQFSLVLNNNSGAAATGVQIVDTLPAGLRYRRGSTTLYGSPVADPAISADGRTLAFAMPDMPDGSASEIRYVVEVVLDAASFEEATRRILAGYGIDQAKRLPADGLPEIDPARCGPEGEAATA